MKKRLLAALASLALILGLYFVATYNSHAQVAQVGNSTLSRVGGNYYATAYALWKATIVSGNTATGSQTIVVGPAQVVLFDGRVITPFSTTVPLTVDMGASNETVTPTAVSFSACPTVGNTVNQNTNCALVTATFSNTHGPGAVVASGDNGIQEAIQDAATFGGGMVFWEIDPGTVTLNTGGATTNAGSVSIPARSMVMSATARVNTTIATCAGGWSLGFVGGTGTDFTGANTTLTAGTTTDSSTLSTPKQTNAAAALPTIFCTTSNASAGAVHPHYVGYKMVAPSS